MNESQNYYGGASSVGSGGVEVVGAAVATVLRSPQSSSTTHNEFSDSKSTPAVVQFVGTTVASTLNSGKGTKSVSCIQISKYSPNADD